MTSLLLSTQPTLTNCRPEPLPVQAEMRTDEFWNEYLNKSLHACFEFFSPLIDKTTVVLGQDMLAEMDCVDNKCTITVGRKLLGSITDPEEALYIIGHEAGHIALDALELQVLGIDENEYAADLLAIRGIVHGGCFGAKVLGWIYDEILTSDKQTFTAEGRTMTMIRQRRASLLAQCMVEAITAPSQ